MGAGVSQCIFGRKESFQFFSRKGNPLTVVSEGEEVVWTNFEAPEKSMVYDLPVRSNGGSESTIGTSTGSKPSRRGSAQPSSRRSSTADDVKVDGKLTGTVPRRPSAASEQRRGSAKETKVTFVDVSPIKDSQNVLATVLESSPSPSPSSSASQHGTKAKDIQPLKVQSQLGPSTGDELAVISLNLLADFNLTNSVNNPEDGRYRHAVHEASWEVRLPRIKALFERHSGADVFALQEVDFSRYQTDLRPFMESIGYSGVHQWDDEFAKKGAPNHPFGVATFFKKGKFREAFREARSRSLLIGLAIGTDETIKTEEKEDEKQTNKKKKAGKNKQAAVNCDWFIVNVHLEADPKKTEKRLGQLSSALFNLSTHAKVDPRTARIVVLGDFNSLREEPPFQWLLANYKPSSEATTAEALDEKTTEEKDDEDKDSNEKMVHAFSFSDAYERADDSIKLAATYADPFANGRVDHLLYTSDTSQILSVLSIPALNETTRKFGLFGKDYPSDHYPVGCVLKQVQVAIEPEAKDDEDDPNYCPLTPGQMRVLLFLEEGAPKKANKSGKPSPTELALMKSHAERVNAFSSHLNPKQKAWVNKWRKKYKPEAKKEEPSARERLTRSKSFAVPQDVFNLGELFRESSTGNKDGTVVVVLEDQPKASDDSALQQKAKPMATKRRQTVHGKTTKFFDS